MRTLHTTGSEPTTIEVQPRVFRHKSIDTKDFMRAEAKTDVGKGIEDNMLVEVDAETDLIYAREKLTKAQNSVSYATPVVDAEECLVDGKERVDCLHV